MRLFKCATTATALLALVLQSVLAQSGEEFLKGKTVSLYIGFTPGGSYDYFGRVAARHMSRHIPGEPTIVARSMPGAGSLQAANFLYSQAPKDGTAWGIVSQTLALEEVLGNPAVRYKAAEFSWIGRLTSIVEVYYVWKTSKATSIEDARLYEIPMAGTGPGSPSEGYPLLLNAFANTKFKIISGYTGSTQGMLAMERGEVDGGLTSWNTLRRTKQDWIRNHDVNILVQFVSERYPQLRGVPTLLDMATTPDARRALAFYVSGAEMGRSLLVPPGIPPDRVAVLRAAFDATMKDPEFIAEVERSGQEFQPGSGAQVEQLVKDVSSVPSEIVGRVKTILRPY